MGWQKHQSESESLPLSSLKLRHPVEQTVTGRLKPLIHTILTIIAFDDFLSFGIPLHRSPGTPPYGLTSDAAIKIHINNPVGFTLFHGTSRAKRRHRPGFRSENRTCKRRLRGECHSVFVCPARQFHTAGAFRELLVLQAIDLTAQTTDTSFFILDNGVITLHGILPGMPFA